MSEGSGVDGGFETGFGGGFETGFGDGALLGSGGASVEGHSVGETLARNVAMVSARSPELARRILETPASLGVELEEGADGGLTGAMVDGDGKRRALASRRRPIAEGAGLAETVDLSEAGVAVVMGFGVGHHVAALCQRMKGAGVVVVFEPDVGLLRAVFERVDLAEAMGAGDVRFVTEPDNEAMVAQALLGVEALVTMGVSMVEHPASRGRLGEASADFGVTLARVVSAIRTNLVTTLMQSGVTIRNELMNLDAYAANGGIAGLEGAAAGMLAVVVSAGPSFRRNAHLLAEPGVRDRVVIVAVQTVLKPLLEMGVRPHFVMALDYHEISARFYEGLSAEDVEGVTLVVEPKANPAIVEAFPGRVACVAAGFLDRLLGDGLIGELTGVDTGGDAGPRQGSLPPGATVAHLAYYFARSLGCDPVGLVGQDLAFTDGQYYSAGASIHNVWACELNEFNTLEMMEWQRVARMGSMLRPMEDVEGRRVYSDEQMSTYLIQFERDFERDRAKGLTTIDATEGGVKKRGTDVSSLAGFLARYAPESRVLDLPEVGGRGLDRATLAKVKDRVRKVRQDVFRVGKLSRETARVLEEAGDDVESLNHAAATAHKKRDEVRALEPAFTLVQALNQTGTLKRAKADREIFLEHGSHRAESAGGAEGAKVRQGAQRARDVMNLKWLGDAADELGRLLDVSIGALDGKGKLTREARPTADDAGVRVTPAGVRAWAVVTADVERNAFGLARDLGAVVADGKHALELTLERLSRSRELSGAVVLTDAPERVGELLGGRRRFGGLEVRVEECEAVGRKSAAVRGARGLSQRAWRGGLGFWTVWDEVAQFGASAKVLGEVGADAGVLVGADWSLVDPGLTDALVGRFREERGRNRFVFSQAAAGLSGALIERGLMGDLAKLEARSGDAGGGNHGGWGSLGVLLGFVPKSPALDPIGRDACVVVPAGVRDALERFVADSARGRALVGGVIERVGMGASPEDVVRAAAKLSLAVGVEEVVAQVVSGARVMEARALRAALDGLDAGFGVTLVGEPDAAGHPELAELVRVARDAGAACVHVRTGLGVDVDTRVLGDGGVDVVSCDLGAVSREGYAAVTGRDDFDATRERLGGLLAGRRGVGGAGVPWIVPRMTRREAVLEEVEAFFSESLTAAGACVIDALEADDGGRVSALPVPGFAAARRAAGMVRVRVDGSVERGAECGVLVGRSEAA